MNNNPNNYKFDPNTGEPLFNNNPVSNNNNVPTEPVNPNPFAAPVEPVIPTPIAVEPAPVVNNTVQQLESVNVAPVEPINNPVPSVGVTPNQINSNFNTNLSQTGYIPPIAPPNAPGYVPPINNNPVYGISNNPEYKKKKSGGKKFVVVFFYIFILAIIGAGVAAFLMPKKKAAPKDVTRTVMIYMVGSDLESKAGYGTTELAALKYDKLDSENVNVVLIAGGSNKWHNDYIDVDETSIFELQEDGFKKVKKQSVKNMADEKTFSEFLNYVYDNYQTDRYDLIFWDHGAAILGSELDQLHNNDILSLEEIKSGLKKSPFNDDNKLEVVIFSTCLNGTIEVADIFKDHADYLVASEESTISVPGGSDFKFIHEIENTDSGYDVAYKFVDSYKAKLKNYYNGVGYNQSKVYSTYSIIDLANVGDLVDAVNDFFDDIDIEENYNLIARVRSNIYQYPVVDEDYDMVDLYNLVDGLKDLSPKKAEKVLDLLETTIAYNWATNSKSRGLSIYFPYKSHNVYIGGFKLIYNKLSSFKGYSDFISKFDSMQSSGKGSSKSYESNKTTVDYKDGEADFTVELTDDQLETFASAKYYVFRKNNDGTYKPFYTNGETYLKGKKLNAKVRGKQLVVKSDDECKPDRECYEEYPLILDELDVDKNYIRYTTTVILEDFTNGNFIMDPARITLVYDTKKGKIEIADVNPLSDDEEDMSSRVSLDIKDYTTIAFSASSSYIINDKGEFVSDGTITGVETSTDSFYFDISNFDDGYEYYCVFVIEDTYGNSSRTDFIKMN